MRYIFFFIGHIASHVANILREEWMQGLAYKVYSKSMHFSLILDSKYEESKRIWKSRNSKYENSKS